MRCSQWLLAGVVALFGMICAPANGQDAQANDRVFMTTVLAHRVSWHTYPGGWSRASVMPRDWPGGYSSVDPTVINAINRQMSANGIWSMVSWWGPGQNYGGDVFMDAFLSQPGDPIAVLYEATGRLKNNFQLNGTPEGQGGEAIDFNVQSNADTFVEDMVHLHQRYFSGPHANRFLRIDGRPVVFIWISHAFDGPFDKAVERVRARVPVYLIGSDFSVPLYARPGIETVVPAMDAISTYGGYWWGTYGTVMTEKYVADYRKAVSDWSDWMGKHAPHMKIMLPMTFNYDERLLTGRHGYHFSSTPAMAEQMAWTVRSIIADPCMTRVLPVTFIVSYDECYEGTCIIPSVEYGSAYQDIVREVFAGPITVTRDQQRECRPYPGRGRNQDGDH